MKDGKAFWLSLSLVCVFWSLYGISAAFAGEKFGTGTFGDAFGALNTLFSGLAFAVLVLTLRRQSEELEMQREELRLQREEMALQREEMQQSRAELAGQKHQLVEQNRLAVLSARLAALPVLITAEKEFLATAPEDIAALLRERDLDGVEQRAERLQDELRRLPDHIAEARKEYQIALQGADLARMNVTGAEMSQLEVRKDQLEWHLPHVRRYIGFEKDMASIYRQLLPNSEGIS